MSKKKQTKNEGVQETTERRESVYPDVVRGADAQNLGLEETRKAREEEEKERKALESRPKSENGMYGNTKPFSAVEVEEPKVQETEGREDGDLSLVRNKRR